jgi:hypothetical protein
VSGIEEEYDERLLVLRVDIQTEAGIDLSKIYGSRVTPTFILLDGAGQELWRSVGNLDVQQIRDAIN